MLCSYPRGGGKRSSGRPAVIWGRFSQILHALARQKECQIPEGHLMPDHVHMCIAIPPKGRSVLTGPGINVPNPGQAVSLSNVGTFGQFTNTRDPRNIQLALKLYF